MFGVDYPDALSKYEKRDFLLSVNLIKEKMCGKIKSRTCANGSPQRNNIFME